MIDGSFWSGLETRVATEGVDAVLASPGSLPEGLRHVLDLEAHHLRGWDRAASPELLAQQVLTRAHALGLPDLPTAARDRIDAQRWTVLGERWRTQPFSPALVRTLSGHRGGIVDAAFAPEGRLFAVSEDGELRVWDVATGTSRTVDVGTGTRPTKLAVSSDGGLLAVACLDRSVVVAEIADLPDGALRTVGRHDGWIHRLRFLPGSPRRLVSASEDRTVVIHDVETGVAVHVLTGHPGEVVALAVSPDGATVVSGAGRTVRVWDAATGVCRQVVEEPDDVFAATFVDDGTLVATSRLGPVHRWDVRHGELRDRTRLDVPRPDRYGPGWPKSVVALPGGRALVANDDAVVDVWRVRPDDPARARVASLTGHRDHTSVAAVSADGRLAVTGDEAGMLLLWDLEAVDDVPDTPLGLYLDVEEIAVSRAAETVVVCPQQALRLVARDTRTGEERWTVADEDDGTRVDVLWFSPSGRTLHTADHRTVEHRSVETGEVVSREEMPGVVKAGRGDHAVVVTTSYRPVERHHLAVVGASTGAVQASVELPPEVGWPRAVATAPGLRSIAVAGDDHLLVWDPLSGHTATVALDVPGRSVRRVAIDDECCHVLATDDAGRVHPWDVASGEVTAVPTGGRLLAVAGLAGHRAVTAGRDGAVTLWDLARARAVGAAPLDSTLEAIAVDGLDVAVGDGAGNTHLLALVVGAPAPAVPESSRAPVPPPPPPGPARPSLLRRLFGRG
ncbi:WD40 repeat domain-containing protein [Actinomycetospora aeridis]|uniref:WD40 repeat domain-containing protein n=1 Tax=Actinomycetospora aeridis TaxID=3129231 RepID=A0ABU8MZ11_9PSEU